MAEGACAVLTGWSLCGHGLPEQPEDGYEGKKKRHPVRGGGPTMLISLESIYGASVIETLISALCLKQFFEELT